MGQEHVGGNGSVITGLRHDRSGPLREKTGPGKPGSDEFKRGGNTDLEAKDGVALAQIGTSKDPELKDIQIPGYFTVRLRLDPGDVAPVRDWLAAANPDVRRVMRSTTEDGQWILVVLVKAIDRTEPPGEAPWGNMPWEVRTNW
jgi:hypothetical protein